MFAIFSHAQRKRFVPPRFKAASAAVVVHMLPERQGKSVRAIVGLASAGRSFRYLFTVQHGYHPCCFVIDPLFDTLCMVSSCAHLSVAFPCWLFQQRQARSGALLWPQAIAKSAHGRIDQ